MSVLKKQHSDKILFFLTILFVAVGYIIFFSASLGLLARDATSFGNIALKQGVIGVCGGFIGLFLASLIPTRQYRTYSLYILILAIITNALLLIPSLSVTYGGATRWLNLGFTTVQPSEFLKLAAILYYAALLMKYRSVMHTARYGLLPLMVMLGVVEGILLLQRDTDPISAMALVAMFFVAGGRWRHLFVTMLIGAIAAAGLVTMRPYLLDRIQTFINPSEDGKGSGYQIQQSLIAIGNGGLLGQGFGQSVQKFKYLPEPVGDSIFAVAAEEFGFVGSSVLILLYTFLALRLALLALKIQDIFGRTIIIGFLITIVGQSYLNIGAMVGILPLTGVPLAFVSHGSTALVFALAEIGIILGVTKQQKS